MGRMINVRIALTAIVILLVQAVAATTPANGYPQTWENIDYKRRVDVSKSYLQETAEIRIKNIDSIANDKYYFALPSFVAETLSYLSASLKDVNAFIDSGIVHDQPASEENSLTFALITLPASVSPGDEIDIVVRFAHNTGRRPFPERIALGDRQTMLITIDELPLSNYETLHYSIEFSGASEFSHQASENSKLAPVSTKGGLALKTSASIPPFEPSPIFTISYPHDGSFPRVNNLERGIWASHWAETLQFEEYFELVNDAAPLESGFSRADYMKKQLALKKGNHLATLEIPLPAEASDTYFTDLVGMVSTYRVFGDRLILKPRYPLFGGWRFNFTIGWTNALSQFLHESKEDETYILSVPILDGPVNTFYDNVSLSVYLPEGSQVVQVESQIPFHAQEVSHKKSYFDLREGHTKISIQYKNMVDDLSKGQLLVVYKLSSQSLYKKPLSIGAYIFCALIAFFVLKSQ
ncbi:LAMI_0H09054g1_1 [Lachancea mirantina]|uniref:Dolichyl-diphosphooligosaccharide--protein glycosyltransferase subunit 1 n=1 Tax=Lachancea mirantina TaxID=1230905 RepID=A0A1G4KGQ8_9SACH|nr:LAMI_0H09054g1_1 [Lachancea mirantina]